jgi:hypothetical protein
MRTSYKININARCERAEINKTEKHCARTIKGVRERGVNHDVIALASGRSALGLLHSRCVYITILSSTRHGQMCGQEPPPGNRHFSNSCDVIKRRAGYIMLPLCAVHSWPIVPQ